MPTSTGSRQQSLLFELLLQHLRTSHHEQRLPDTEPDSGNDASKQTADAGFLDNVRHHANHVTGGNTRVTTALGLDARYFERVIPRRQRTTHDTATDFFPFAQLGAGIAVQHHLCLVAHNLSETLSRRPVGRLSKSDRRTAWIKSSYASAGVRRANTLHRRLSRVIHRAGDEIRTRSHHAHLRDPTTGTCRDARQTRSPARGEEGIVDALLGVHQNRTLGRGFKHFRLRTAPESLGAALSVNVCKRFGGRLGAVTTHARLPHLEGHAEGGSLRHLDERADRDVDDGHGARFTLRRQR